MQHRLLHSFSFRLAFTYMALFGASVLLLLWFIYWSTAAYMSRQADVTIAAEITGLSERYDMDGLAGLIEVINERLSRKPTGSSIYLLTTAITTPIAGNLNRWPTVQADKDGWLNFRLENAGRNKKDVHLARARSFTLSGGFHLLVGRDIYELEETQQRIIHTLILGFAITLVLGGVGGFVLSRRVMKRLEAINTTSREIINGDLSRRIALQHSGDEFDSLAGNLNAMLDRIEELMEGVRRVSDSIAHDLRTPLARLRNRLELLRTEQEKNHQDPTLTEQALNDADGLLKTFNALLRIARIETRQHKEAFSETDMGALLHDVVELYEPLAEEKGQSLRLQVDADVNMQGDRDLLFQAMANLLDNAIKYTPPQGHIEITLEKQDDSARISIADSGPGIPESEREQVFQRFYRLEKSRTTPGNGLGLSLVAAVARIHGMTLRLEDNQPGLRIVCEFPINPATHSGTEKSG
ncbi:Sensor protein basS/pmrB [hydrothermal vent metagenome]|uniref:histidine kinase n=1 Tax=hydrothermal vent metagenome TaxID=652676 RepID=A0A3B0Z3D8_9ZZZZ